MDDPSIMRVPQTHCAGCNATLNAAGTVDGSPYRPKPGDPIACLKCGAVMTVNAAGAVVGFTDAQMAELMADPVAVIELARVVRRIKFIRATVN